MKDLLTVVVGIGLFVLAADIWRFSGSEGFDSSLTLPFRTAAAALSIVTVVVISWMSARRHAAALRTVAVPIAVPIIAAFVVAYPLAQRCNQCTPAVVLLTAPFLAALGGAFLTVPTVWLVRRFTRADSRDRAV